MPRAPETCFDCGRPIDVAETLLGDAAFHPACAEAFCIRNADEIGGKPCARCGGTVLRPHHDRLRLSSGD